MAAHPMVKISRQDTGQYPRKGVGKLVRLQGGNTHRLMKRIGNIYPIMVSDGNLETAILKVNDSHRWLPGHQPNKTVAWVEEDIPARIKELREFIEGLVNGTETLHPPIKKRRYDKSAGKWRDINEPILWPDQYVHHALVQVLQTVMMRGMDHYCCGSIRGRGIHYGVEIIKDWMGADPSGTKYCGELDIYHFYESIDPKTVVERLKRLVKDWRVLKVCEAVLAWGVLIGVYTSQWFANVLLQPLDQLIRESGLCKYYLRYMDNFTILGPNKRKLRKLRQLIEKWLATLGLKLKGNWQIFRTTFTPEVEKRHKKLDERKQRFRKPRIPSALGYRYGKGFTLLRKRNLLRLKRSLARYYWRKKHGRKISRKMAAGLLSRLGQLRHCNHVGIYRRIYRTGTQRELKDIIRKYTRKEQNQWNTSSEQAA